MNRLWLILPLAACSDTNDEDTKGPSTRDGNDSLPVVSIVAPDGSDTYYSDQAIAISATVTDAEDGPNGLTVAWRTDDGPLELATAVEADGSLTDELILGEGEHTIWLEATDSDGNTGSDRVSLTVGGPNRAPECGITAPEDGSSVAVGEELRFAGVASDPDISSEQLSVVWSSDVDGELRAANPEPDGTIGFATSSLTPATHRVSVLVTDEVGVSCGDAIYVTVGAPPSLEIDTPVDGERVNVGAVVSFAGRVSDGEDRPEALSLTWVSSLDGVFSEEGADSTGALDLSVDGLQPGAHDLEITVTDSDGLYAIDRRTLTINALPTAPTVVLSPEPAVTTDDLVVTATDSIDPDGSGAVSFAYAWTEDGVSLSETGPTLPASVTAKNHNYRVTVTPSDDLGSGDEAFAEVTVSNSAPVLSGPSLSASTAVVGDTLTCSATATDADGDTVALSYAWSDGSTGATYAVTSSDDPGDTITCTATADDGDGGVATGTASATVTNTDPTVDSVSVSPSTGQVGDTLTCSATASDADGGSPSVDYAWSTGDTGATYTLQSSDDPGDAITCTATATDTDGGSASDTASATVVNTDPVVGAVSISPSSANNDDTLTCSATTTDADGDTPTLSYAWTGSSSGSLGTSSTVDLSATSAESAETVTCTATASDPDGGSDTGTASLSLDNRDPSVSVSLSPSSGATQNDTLTCTAVVADDDDDSLTTTFSWTVAGAAVSASSTSGLTSTLAGTFVAGNLVACTADTADGKGGTDSASASTSIVNNPPTISAVTLDKSTLYTNDALTASVSTSDADGDTVTVTYDWIVAGTSVQSGTSDTLNGASASAGFDKGDTVYVVATASDGTDTATATSTTLTVLNTPPGAPVVAITPADPEVGEDLVCEVTTASTDADGDTVTYTMSWTVDAASHTGALTTTWTGDTVDGADTAGEEEWECTATPNDGDDDGATGTDSVTVNIECGDGTITLTESSISFVTICSGSFDMGCTAGQSNCASNESPVMPVTLTHPYYMSETEVTQAQYQALMGSNPSYFASCGSTCPVENLTWSMMAAFANALSNTAGLTECYSCAGTGSSVSCAAAMNPYTCEGYRLPTEAEWEGAARCGEDLLYAGSNTLSDVAVYGRAYGVGGPTAVAGKDPNACGLYDMSGNVWERGHDWYSATYYVSTGRTDPTGPTSGTHYVNRGGGYYDDASGNHRVANRSAGTAAFHGTGFRLARTVNP